MNATASGTLTAGPNEKAELFHQKEGPDTKIAQANPGTSASIPATLFTEGEGILLVKGAGAVASGTGSLDNSDGNDAVSLAVQDRDGNTIATVATAAAGATVTFSWSISAASHRLVFA